MALTNITFSADEAAVAQARERAAAQNTTLNAEFRRWLAEYTGRASGEQRAREYTALMLRLAHVRTGGRAFSRDEMNER